EHPAPIASNPIPSILPLVNTGGGAGPRSVAIPDSITILEIPPSEDPISSKEVVALLDFDRRLSSAPEIRRALDSMPPSARSSEPVSAPPPGVHPPRRGHSIMPAFRAAEISTRIERADVEQNEMPVSQRMFLQLSALIDDARNEVAPGSLRPLRLDVQKLAEAG